ncbi:MAG: hypothetical protein IKH11_03245, partial [Bacteroidales bacterium]|nr:hypothetical protein [Bacteroidales bacterium]
MKKILFAFVSLLVAAGVQAFACASPKYLTYEQFGAKGDGVADDFPAIIATHAAANIKGLPVKAAGGKTYYIGNTTGTAVIRTDVDFGTARFIIDDSHVSLEDREDYIFRIESPFEPFDIDGIGSLKRDQTNIGKSLIALREDYGSSWEGEVIVRNCKLIVPEGAKNVSILRGSNAGEHDFGYTCYLPEIIDIENL